ncbi:MAG TPA: UDP-N-acetylmuramate dehydrogenase [Marinagarivorans sp.]
MTPPANWREQYDISRLNTMAAPSRAQYFVEVNAEDALLDAVRAAKAADLSVSILAGGSNVLCPPLVEGLVVQPSLLGQSVVVAPCGLHAVVTVQAGENWHQLVRWCVANGYYGLENLALIPGRVGAAPIQNIGAYGVELSDVLLSVKWLDLNTERFYRFDRQDCQLGYRDSIFKRELSGRAVITEVTLQLNLQANPSIRYQPLADYFSQTGCAVTPQAVFDAVCRERESKLPDPKKTPNSGSFFKNPVITQKQFEALKAQYPAVPSYPQGGDAVKIPAAWLIDQCGLKGQNVCGLLVHAKQALVLTNPKKRDLATILAASDKIAACVFDAFAVKLEREPQILGNIC